MAFRMLRLHRSPAPAPRRDGSSSVRPPGVIPTPFLAMHLTTGFEDWCDAQGLHPEAYGVWEAYEAALTRTLPETGVA